MSKAHDRDAARPLQAQVPQNLRFDLATVIACGGGILPPTGRFSFKMIGLLTGKDPETVRQWVKEKDIEVTPYGDEFYVEMEDFHAAHSRNTAKYSQRVGARGGNRRNKKG